MKKDSYGYEINKAILEISDGAFGLKEATLYTAFRRLESEGCIISYWGDEQTGARRRYYAITELGKKTYQTLAKDWTQARNLLNQLIGLEGNDRGN